MPYSQLTPPIHIKAERLDNSDPLRASYYGTVITINKVSEVYGRVCLNFANLTIELYDGAADPKPIATIPLLC